MTAQIIELSAYRAAHPGKAVRVRLVYDPFWMCRILRLMEQMGEARNVGVKAKAKWVKA